VRDSVNQAACHYGDHVIGCENKMPNFKAVVPNFAVASQLEPEDFSRAKGAGYRSVICNRPDGETLGQLQASEAETACRALGLQFAFIPVAGGFALSDVEATAQALASLEAPILAYCRSGTRSITLWGLASAKAGTYTPDEITHAAKEAGYDLGGFAPTLAKLYEAG
jgi:sulfide:quinone oxidoreductase